MQKVNSSTFCLVHIFCISKMVITRKIKAPTMANMIYLSWYPFLNSLIRKDWKPISPNVHRTDIRKIMQKLKRLCILAVKLEIRLMICLSGYLNIVQYYNIYFWKLYLCVVSSFWPLVHYKHDLWHLKIKSLKSHPWDGSFNRCTYQGHSEDTV